MGYSFDQCTPRCLHILSPITPNIDLGTTRMTYLKSVYHVLTYSQNSVHKTLILITLTVYNGKLRVLTRWLLPGEEVNSK